MLKLDIVGRRLRGEAAEEAQHFYQCEDCVQAVDKRDLGAVLHHEQPGHAPLPWAEALRLVVASDLLDAVFKERT